MQLYINDKYIIMTSNSFGLDIRYRKITQIELVSLDKILKYSQYYNSNTILYRYIIYYYTFTTYLLVIPSISTNLYITIKSINK